MSNARVHFDVIRHAIQHPVLGQEHIPRTPGVAIGLSYDLGDEIAAFTLLDDAIVEAQRMMADIIAKTAAKRDWASDQVTPAEVSFIHPRAAKEPLPDYTDYGGRKWWRKPHD